MNTPTQATPHSGAVERSPAQFFFEVGFGAAYAEAVIQQGDAPFALSDALIERAWEIAGEAHDDPAEFDRYLAQANASQPPAPVAAPDGEQQARSIVASVAEELGYCEDDVEVFRSGNLDGDDLLPVMAVERALAPQPAASIPAAGGEPDFEAFAKEWHRAVEVILTMAGLSPALGAQEAIAAMQERLQPPAGDREAVAKAAEFLLWCYDNGPAVEHAKEAWEALRLALRSPAADPTGEKK
jgi:hypothetical protein